MITDKYYFVGELPPPLPVEVRDRMGALDTGLSGAAMVAKTSLNEGANVDVPCTNNDDGTLTIDWDTSTTRFSEAGVLVIKVKVTPAAGGWYYLKRFELPIYE